MFLGIPGLNKFIASVEISQLDDLADRFNYFYTVLALVFFSLLIGTKQHFGEPIRCLMDQQYSGSWIGYVHDYCFISERYSLTPPEYETNELANFDPTAEKKYENYYQWVPFLLAAQALAFYVPHFLWRWLQKASNLDMAVVVNEAIRTQEMYGDERKSAVKNLVRYFEQCVRYQFRHSFLEKFTNFAQIGWYSSFIYVLAKLLNIANTVLQLHIVNSFVGDGTLFWGYQLLKDLWTGQDWTNTGHFPRVVYCDYEKYELANIQHKTVQCTLAINILNEKVFALISAWLLLLFAINVVSATYTVIWLIMPSFRESFVSQSIEAFGNRKRMIFDDCPPGNESESRDKELSECCLSTQTSASFHSKIRRQLCAAAECGGNVDVQNERKAREFAEREEALLYHRLVSLAYKDKSAVHKFVQEAVYQDGMLLLHFIQTHAGGMIASDIIFELWADYVKAKESRGHLTQPRIMNGATPGAPAWEKEAPVPNGNKYAPLPLLPGADLVATDADPLLKPNDEYAQVIDATNLCPISSTASTRRVDNSDS